MRFWRRPRVACTALALGLTLPAVAHAGEQPVRYSSAHIRVIAVCPGVAIHGLGHLAAGDPDTARWLFIAETAGYAAMFTAGSRGRRGLDRSTPRAIAFGTGAALFVGSWVYDILAAPSAPRVGTHVDLSADVDPAGRAVARAGLRVPLRF